MLERLRRRLVQRAVAQETALDRDSFLTGLRAKLRDARVRSELWELQVVGMKAIVPGLVETYRLSRQALREALRQPDDEHLHEWRKMVKHHWSQLGLLRGLAPEFSEVRRQAAGRLAALASESGLQDEADASLLDRLILAQMESLAERSLDLGRQLFEERPRAVARRWRGYWEDWRAAERLREAAL